MSISSPKSGDRLGGPAGNEKLTVAAAVVLLVLLAAIGVTVIDMGGLRREHMILGLVLIPPVLLKLASTGWRFARYYLNSRPYRAKGPPPMALRLLAPVLIVTTVVVFATGVLLLVDGHKAGILLEVHKVSFIVWVVFFGLHVLGHLQRVARPLIRPPALETPVPGNAVRALLLATAVGTGAALAIAVLPAIDSWRR